MAAARKPASKGLRVTAPLVAVQIGAQVLQYVRGDMLPEGVAEDSIKHLKSLGYVEDIDAPAESDDK